MDLDRFFTVGNGRNPDPAVLETQQILIANNAFALREFNFGLTEKALRSDRDFILIFASRYVLRKQEAVRGFV